MKRPDNIASQSILAAIKKSAFLSTKALRARISRRSSRFSTLAVGIALGALLVGLTLFGSMFARGGSVSATTESIFTSAANCIDPQPNNSWNLGGTVCATATGTPQPVNGFRQRRFQWVAPDGSVAQQTDVTADPQNDTYTVPLSGAFGQVGTWRVQTVDNDGGITSEARFTLRDPAHFSADLSVNKFGPIKAAAGSNITYTVIVTNQGPDDALNVVLTDTTPANTTFVSETQVSGPNFNCGDPPTPPCTISTLAAGAMATFSLTYNVTAGTPAETVISNTASVSSTTAELFQPDNSSSFQTTVTSAATTCTVNCPVTGFTVNNDPNQCSAVVTYSTPSTSGTCGSPPDSDVTCNPPSGSTFPVGATVVNCSTQSGGTCSFTVTVNDTRSPVQPTISCPGNVTVNEDSPGSGSAAVNYAAPTTTGNCVTTLCNPPSGSRFAFGTTTVNCTGEDSSDNPVACSFTVTVNASTCGLACPDDQNVNESSPGSGSATVTYSSPTTVGNCPTLTTITCTPPSGSSFSVGLTQVNCNGTDVSSNVVASCSFTVRVNSSSGCTITCPANITEIANASCPSGNPPPNDFTPCRTITWTPPTKSGTCSSADVVCNPPSGSSFGVGTTTVHCSATDPAGNDTTCSFTVTITGGTPCVITCPANVNESSTGCGKVVTYSTPTTTGSCGGDPNDPPFPPIPACSPPSGSFFPVGTTTVTCITDVGTQCSFNVTIDGTDTFAPTIIECPTASSVSGSCQGSVPNVANEVIATDNCTPTDLLVITQNPAVGTIVGTGTTTITLTVRDSNNNTTTCETTFTVTEAIPPTAVCKDISKALDASGNASITGADVDNGSSDNCGIDSLTVSPSTFTCANKGPNTVTLTVTDASGNSSQCTATVTVVDNTPPTISCPASVVQSTDPNQCTALVTYSNATATDNCANVGTPACSPASGTTFPKGTATVNCSVSDASGNPATCQFTVTVNDTQPPAITCPANIVKEPTCPSGAVATYAPVVSDNCPGVTFVCSPASGSTFAVGTTTVTCTATDAAPSNNTAQCSLTVTVLTASATIQNLKTSVNSSSLNGSQKQGLVSKLDAALDAIGKGNTNPACAKLADFINSVQNFIDHGNISAAQGQAWIDSATKVRNYLGCTNLPCS